MSLRSRFFFAAALILALCLPSLTAMPDAGKAIWVCPPCNNPCDDREFDAPGTCPGCGMQLVKKTASGAPAARLRLAVLLFPGVQIIDYTGPWEVFGHVSVSNEFAFEIYSVAEKAGSLTTSMGMSVNPKYTFETAPDPDVILLPGGAVAPQLENAAVIGWIRAKSDRARVVFSVCNGAFFLAKAGLLDGLEATTFAGLIPALRQAAPKTRVLSDRRFVDNGKVVTAAGLSSGIDGALHVVEKLFGRGQAEVVATALEYHWQPDSKWARAMLADRNLNPVYDWVHQFTRSVVAHKGDERNWETSWKLTTGKPGTEILQDLAQKLEGGQKWSATADGSASSSKRAWSFKDDDGKRWSAIASVAPAEGDPTARLLTVRVARTP